MFPSPVHANCKDTEVYNNCGKLQPYPERALKYAHTPKARDLLAVKLASWNLARKASSETEGVTRCLACSCHPEDANTMHTRENTKVKAHLTYVQHAAMRGGRAAHERTTEREKKWRLGLRVCLPLAMVGTTSEMEERSLHKQRSSHEVVHACLARRPSVCRERISSNSIFPRPLSSIRIPHLPSPSESIQTLLTHKSTNHDFRADTLRVSSMIRLIVSYFHARVHTLTLLSLFRDTRFNCPIPTSQACSTLLP